MAVYVYGEDLGDKIVVYWLAENVGDVIKTPTGVKNSHLTRITEGAGTLKYDDEEEVTTQVAPKDLTLRTNIGYEIVCTSEGGARTECHYEGQEAMDEVRGFVTTIPIRWA